MGNPKGFPHLHVYKPFGFVHYIMGEYTPFSLRGKGLSNGAFGPSVVLAAER